MKVVFFRVDSQSKAKRTAKAKINIEKVLFVSFIAAFTILIIAQAALITPSVRTFMTGRTEFEGKQLGLEEYLYDEGKITLELFRDQTDSGVKILVNGDEVAAFNNSVVSLTVRDGDVVEIDGSSLDSPAEIAVVSKTSNISDECLKKTVVKGNVKLLTQVRMK